MRQVVACMTTWGIRRSERTQLQGRLWPRQQPRIPCWYQSHATKMSHLVRSIRWGYLGVGLLFELPIGVARNGSRSDLLLISRRHVSWRTHTILKRCKTVILKAWQSWTYLVPMSLGNLRLPMILYDRSDLVWGLAYFTKPLGIKLPPYFWYPFIWSSSDL